MRQRRIPPKKPANSSTSPRQSSPISTEGRTSEASTGNSLLRLLQLSVQPAVLLLLDEQDDDVAFFEAEQRGVVAGRVGEDRPHPGLSAHVETGRLGRGPGHAALCDTAPLWKPEDGITSVLTKQTEEETSDAVRGGCWFRASEEAPVPELLSAGGLKGILGSWLNMSTSGLIWAFSCGAGGGTFDPALY